MIKRIHIMKHVFEWDNKKEQENIKKHGISFIEAKEVFYDESRVIAVDEKHSQKEPRMFCIGNIGKGVVTVRFIYNNGAIRIFEAGYWRKGRSFYEEKNQRQK
jgi:uncharacterized DUF497 family protein